MLHILYVLIFKILVRSILPAFAEFLFQYCIVIKEIVFQKTGYGTAVWIACLLQTQYLVDMVDRLTLKVPSRKALNEKQRTLLPTLGNTRDTTC